MKYYFALRLSGSVLAGLVFFTSVEPQPVPRNLALLQVERTKMSSACLTDREIQTQLRSISSAQSLTEQETARKQLVEGANRADDCRQQVIGAIMRAMANPPAELHHDRSRFYLWHYGSEILAILKAEESLDLLIEHFDLHDGTPFPLNHHPAVVNVIRMGSTAIPKLDAVLRQSNNPNSRQYAVFCIASIGGPDAQRVLSQALPVESNTCVKSFITASLAAWDSSHSQISAERRTDWYAAFLCNTP